jgi:hypothetical protein
MSRLPSAQAEAALERLADQFTQWRQSRPRRARIPNAWWVQAVSLTYVLPVSRVAKRLGLGLTELKKRRGSPPSAAAAAAPLTFVEVTAARPRPTPGVELEVQRPDGTRLRLTAGEATPALTALLQTFWEGHS